MAKIVGSVLLVLAAVVGLAYCACSAEDDLEIDCPDTIQPVCATFKKTFDNQCELTKNRCELASKGFELVDTETGDCCDRDCQADNNLVCGCDGSIFPNECALRQHACLNRGCIPLDLTGCLTDRFF